MNTPREVEVPVICTYCGRPTGRTVLVPRHGSGEYRPAPSGGICKACKARNAAGLTEAVRRKLGW